MVTMRQPVWITGASSGIAAALATTAPDGARVIGISRRPASVGESVRADLSEPSEWNRVSAAIAAVLEADRPEIPMLLHFAGAAEPTGPMRNAEPEAYAKAVLLNAAAGQVLGAVSFEGANPRHEHEWETLAGLSTPDDKILIPGVIDTKTNVVEHPHLIAQRIGRFANIVGRERVIPGTDCGFATFAGFGMVEPEVAWMKLAALGDGAAEASERLWPAGAVIA
jgi:methionine synthase II (cobalamin-independent)